MLRRKCERNCLNVVNSIWDKLTIGRNCERLYTLARFKLNQGFVKQWRDCKNVV